MSFLPRWNSRIKISPFKVGIYGKLPCYKDFFFASPNLAFSEWKNHFDMGFEKLTSSDTPRPFVTPNRRFYIDMKNHKLCLVGCIWESDDGRRGYPFMLAAPIQRTFVREPFPAFWQCLEHLWEYLEKFAEEVFAQSNSDEVYSLCRGTTHRLPPFVPVKWAPCDEEPPQPLENAAFTTNLLGLSPEEEAQLIRAYGFKENPAFVMWPMPTWQNQDLERVPACFGRYGMEDFHMGLFRKTDDAPLEVKT